MIFIWDYRTLGKNWRKTSEKFKVKNRTLAKTARMRHPGSKTETPTCGPASCIAPYPKARVLRARLRQHGKQGDRRACCAAVCNWTGETANWNLWKPTTLFVLELGRRGWLPRSRHGERGCVRW